jgi:hypothetical protein
MRTTDDKSGSIEQLLSERETTFCGLVGLYLG